MEIAGVIAPSQALALAVDATPRARGMELVPSNVPAFIPSGLDDFTGLLSVEDTRVMVDLLKLAVANRVGEKGRETLAAVLTALSKTKAEVGAIHLCKQQHW